MRTAVADSDLVFVGPVVRPDVCGPPDSLGWVRLSAASSSCVHVHVGSSALTGQPIAKLNWRFVFYLQAVSRAGQGST